jgi:2-hydroxy-3-keto-5-methylthiopentenyl-1-phosphate phosphatase
LSVFRVFCDFDGTVAREDVGRKVFSHFVGQEAERTGHLYVTGQITARECLLQEAGAVDDLSSETFADFVVHFAIDEHFKEFCTFCRTNEMPVTILSDGLDFYVERMLDRGGLGGSAFFANHLEFKNAGVTTRLEVTFPYSDSDCLFCGNCKRNHMLTLAGEDDIIVYVGDGISDRCPVRYADVVFAKKELIKYCQEENISYYEFNNFRDVQDRLETLLNKKRIKKRRQAEMARRDAYMQG